MDLTLRPSRHAFAVVPSDTTDLAPRAATKGLYIGTAGTLSVILMDGTTVNFPAVNTGHLTVQVKRVRATGTTATGIIALA